MYNDNVMPMGVLGYPHSPGSVVHQKGSYTRLNTLLHFPISGIYFPFASSTTRLNLEWVKMATKDLLLFCGSISVLSYTREIIINNL